jgi:ATP-binding cassette, subfamily C (CFTR/MRP), member 1
MLLLSSPATGLFVKRLTGLRRRMLLETDSRVKLMNQLLVGIRVLKLYAWEAAQEAAVSALQLRQRVDYVCTIPGIGTAMLLLML